MAQGSKIEVKSDSETEEQEAMAFMRERYLYLLSNLCVAGMGECNVTMYENTNVKCHIKAVDSNFGNVIVENLVTPLPVPINKAILRTNDIISMEFTCDYAKIMNKF
ncbi:hypothetical protein Zmor_022379 [Zophobas morio]|uniref:Gem-associated protein 7 n=1 Tax=Zophobas morio TaxID=2755281 RepID=A0AA38HV78_9CUCU|nr:hypothetical protein Zmor_022379 [Zophobas morio]